MALNQLRLSLQFGRNLFDGDRDPLARHRAVLTRSHVTRWIRHALALDAEITVRIVGHSEGQQLNHQYRHKDYATNVLTFDYQQSPPWWPTWCCAPPWSTRSPGARQNPGRALRPPAGTRHLARRKAGEPRDPARTTRKRWRLRKPPSCKNWATQTPTPRTEPPSCPRGKGKQRGLAVNPQQRSSTNDRPGADQPPRPGNQAHQQHGHTPHRQPHRSRVIAPLPGGKLVWPTSSHCWRCGLATGILRAHKPGMVPLPCRQHRRDKCQPQQQQHRQRVPVK